MAWIAVRKRVSDNVGVMCVRDSALDITWCIFGVHQMMNNNVLLLLLLTMPRNGCGWQPENRHNDVCVTSRRHEQQNRTVRLWRANPNAPADVPCPRTDISMHTYQCWEKAATKTLIARRTGTFLPRDAMLASYMLSLCVWLSVRPSFTRRYCIKTAKCRITHTTPYGSPETLVFWCHKSRRNSNGVNPTGRQIEVGQVQTAVFDQYLAVSQKRSKTGT